MCSLMCNPAPCNAKLASALSVERIREAELSESLRREWNELAGDVPFRAPAWQWTWQQNYAQANDEPFLLAVRDAQGQLIALAPWQLHATRSGARIVRFLGSGEVCSDYMTLLTRPGLEQPAAERLALWLDRESGVAWSLIELTGVERDDPAVSALASAMNRLGNQTHVRPDLNCWRTKLPATWEGFLAGLSKSRRERTRSLCRKYFDTKRAEIHWVRTHDELRAATPLLIDLHQKRRASLGQPGCFASPQFESFLRQACGAMLDEGRLRMFWLAIDGRPAAAECSFTGPDAVYFYQCGFDPEQAAHRPGTLSFAASLRRAIEEGYSAFDFLRGDESYKASWRAEPRPLAQWRIVGKQPTAQARFLAWRAGESGKRWARRSLSWAGARSAKALAYMLREKSAESTVPATTS